MPVQDLAAAAARGAPPITDTDAMLSHRGINVPSPLAANPYRAVVPVAETDEAGLVTIDGV